MHYASHSAIPVIFANRLKKLNIYTNVHGSDVVPENDKQEKFQKYTKKILSISNKIIVPSKYFQEYVSKKYKIDEEKMCIYPSGGVNKEFFYKYNNNKRKEIIKKLNLDDNFIYVGFVGRISYKKGWDIFVKAANIILNYRDDIKFVIVGNGPDEEQLNKLIEEYKISDKIIRYDLLSQEKLVELYNILSLFIFPTEREGESLGLVAIEAMSCAVPVIASDYAAPKYYIKELENGFKFQKGNVDELVAKIKLFIDLPHEIKIKMQEAASKMSDEYSTEKTRVLLKSIFE